ncbi:MAG: NUDIX hydrolase [Flaviflexus sp.]|nr:NUDIX hydrolase [Flaviflexus sp.]
MWDSKRADYARVTQTVRHYEGGVFSFVSEDIVLPGAEVPVRRDFVDHPGAVIIVPVNERREVLLLSQYRHPARMVLWELPAGLRDAEGEDPLETAQRELAEEANLAADRWHVLVDILSSPGATNEAARIFLARDLRTIDSGYERTDEEADFDYRWVDIAQAARLVAGGQLHNNATVTGILSAVRALDDDSLLREPDAPWLS